VKDYPATRITRDEIQNAAAQIAKSLQEDGLVAMERLARELKLDRPVFDWAIGYLVHQDEVEIIRDGDSFLIRRKKPDTHAAVFI
jgi:hypothetical protein